MSKFETIQHLFCLANTYDICTRKLDELEDSKEVIYGLWINVFETRIRCGDEFYECIKELCGHKFFDHYLDLID